LVQFGALTKVQLKRSAYTVKHAKVSASIYELFTAVQAHGGVLEVRLATLDLAAHSCLEEHLLTLRAV